MDPKLSKSKLFKMKRNEPEAIIFCGVCKEKTYHSIDPVSTALSGIVSWVCNVCSEKKLLHSVERFNEYVQKKNIKKFKESRSV